MSMSEHESVIDLSKRPLFKSDIAAAPDWIANLYDDQKKQIPMSMGKFIAINELVVFAPDDTQHIDVYAQVMHEESPLRDEVRDQVAVIAKEGLPTLRASFVTDAGHFLILPTSKDDPTAAIVEMREQSFYFNRANFAGRQQTVSHVRSGLAAIGLDTIDVHSDY